MCLVLPPKAWRGLTEDDTVRNESVLVELVSSSVLTSQATPLEAKMLLVDIRKVNDDHIVLCQHMSDCMFKRTGNAISF